MYNRTYFKQICSHWTDSTPEINYNTQVSKNNIKISAFRNILVRSAKVYVQQSLGLLNATGCICIACL